jgi:hypothetical protein
MTCFSTITDLPDLAPFCPEDSNMFSEMLVPTYWTIYLWLYITLLGLGRFFSFLIFYTVGRTPWRGRSACQKAATYSRDNTDTE